MSLSVVAGAPAEEFHSESGGDLAAARPLVVDLDGTLLNSDLLVESMSALVASSPERALRACWKIRDGKAALKAGVAACVDLDLDLLPWNEAVVSYLLGQHARGRRLYLASASDRRWVEAVAGKFRCFEGIFASDGRRNLSGAAKAAVLTEAFGASGFDYLGNARVDIPVWQAAGRPMVANASAGTMRRVRALWPDAEVIKSPKPSLRQYLRAIRPHHWLKNLLVFLPALTAHTLTPAVLGACLLTFLSFSLCASSVYLLNDLIDLERDRNHPTKRLRPFASGRIPILHGFVLTPALLGLAALSGLAVSAKFLGVLAVYYALTLAYSLFLKRQMMLDAVTLACLYGMRLVGGAVAADVPLSAWLGAFSIFFFMSLALVKRTTELVGRISKAQGDPGGRGYKLADLPIVEMLSAASGMTAVLVYALYVNSPAVQILYNHPNRLSLICVVLIYWLSRVVILAHRGEMHDDPIVFAATDRTSQICGLLTAAIAATSL